MVTSVPSRAQRTAAVRTHILGRAATRQISLAAAAQRAVLVGPRARHGIRASNLTNYTHSNPNRRSLPGADACDALDVVFGDPIGTLRALAGHPTAAPTTPNAAAVFADHVERISAALGDLDTPEQQQLAVDLAIGIMHRLKRAA